MLRLTCPPCRGDMAVSGRHAGQTVSCPHCRQPLRVRRPVASFAPEPLICPRPVARRPRRGVLPTVLVATLFLGAGLMVFLLTGGISLGRLRGPLGTEQWNHQDLADYLSDKGLALRVRPVGSGGSWCA
jgi:hypothetical protein